MNNPQSQNYKQDVLPGQGMLTQGAMLIVLKYEFLKRVKNRVYIAVTAIFAALILAAPTIIKLISSYIPSSPSPSPSQIPNGSASDLAGMGNIMGTPQYALGLLFSIGIFVLIVMYGQVVAFGVVEEKSSRVVEILLACVKPWQLMAGKVLGIGLSALLQVAVIIAAASYSLGSSGALKYLNGVDFGMMPIYGLLWFIVGFFTYATLYAAIASTVSRQSDLSNASMPMSLFMVTLFYVSIWAVPVAHGEVWVKVLEFLPLTAPMIMPAATGYGVVSGAESIISIAISIVFLPLIIRFSAYIYENAILHTGSRIKITALFKQK
jgi:ABC-type Na+ efflux pump permease subunit